MLKENEQFLKDREEKEKQVFLNHIQFHNYTNNTLHFIKFSQLDVLAQRTCAPKAKRTQ